MIFYVLRGIFILLATTVAVLYVLPFQKQDQLEFMQVAMMLFASLVVSAGVIAADVLTPKKTVSSVSGVFLGLLAGLLGAYAMSFVVDLIGVIISPDGEPTRALLNLLQGVKVFIGLITCYASISLVLQTKDDFRFVIPYVEFTKQIRGQRPTLVDTSVIIDGRIVDLAETNTLQGALIIPKFVLNELQNISDSSDKLRRARGRRGLDCLAKLQETQAIDVIIDDSDAQGSTVDQKLVAKALEISARLMTNDFNLTKVARVRHVEVINLNDLAKSLRPVVLPGETMHIRLVKPGESPTQGVGYLEDGTMVVVENARQQVGEEVAATVSSTLQTSAGRMIFAKLEDASDDDDQPSDAPGKPESAKDQPKKAATRSTSNQSAGGGSGGSAGGGGGRQNRSNPGRNPRRG